MGTPFLSSYEAGFAPQGLMYIPSACRRVELCGLQVRFHGCGSVVAPSQEQMALAESNKIALVHPSIAGLLYQGNNATQGCHVGTSLEGACKSIARGCWDGYGQLAGDYRLKSGVQMQTIARMIDHITSPAPSPPPTSPPSSSPFPSPPLPTPPRTPKSQDGGDGASVGLIVGVVAGISSLLAVSAAVACFILCPGGCRSLKNNKNTPSSRMVGSGLVVEATSRQSGVIPA